MAGQYLAYDQKIKIKPIDNKFLPSCICDTKAGNNFLEQEDFMYVPGEKKEKTRVKTTKK